MAQSVDSRLDGWLGWLLPPRCVLCGRPGQRPSLDLCAACDRELPRIRGNELSMRGPVGDRLHASFAYAPPVDAMVQALKYGGQLALGRVLGQLLARSVAELGRQFEVDCLLPVPLHPLRHAERGFNQSAEIAIHAARQLGLPVEPRLAVRRAQTRPQVGLPPVDRRSNLAGAFAASPAGVQGRRVVIVDDVVTTGSTVAELARALHAAGAVSVDAWCVAHSGPPTPSRGCRPENPSVASVMRTAPSR